MKSETLIKSFILLAITIIMLFGMLFVDRAHERIYKVKIAELGYFLEEHNLEKK